MPKRIRAVRRHLVSALLARLITAGLILGAGFAPAAPPAPSAAPSLDAIAAALAAGNDTQALEQAQALAGDPRTRDWPPLQQARLQVLLARGLDRGEQHSEAVIEASTRALDLLGTPPADAALAREALQLRGLAHTRMGEAEPALSDLRAAVQASRSHDGETSATHAMALADLSLAERIAAEYGAALTSLDTALSILRRQSPPDQQAIARTLIRLGQTRRISGDLERAEAAYREALALDQAQPDPSGRNRATVLYALGNLYRNRNEAERAIDYYARAVPAMERVYGKDSLQLSVVLNNYGNAESLRAGRGDAAVALFERALAIAERRQSRNPSHYLPQANIAMVRVWQGRYVDAERGFRNMLQRLHDVPAGSESSPLFAQHGLAAALWGQGRHADAFAAAEAAEATRQASVREVADGLSDAQALAFQEQDYATLDQAIGIALDSGNADLLARAWALAIAARGQLTALQTERLTRARASTDPALAPLWQAWLSASATLERSRLDGADNAGAALVQLEQVERRLALALPQTQAMAHQPIGVADLASALPNDAALIWLHDLRHQGAGEFANAAVDIEPADTWAFVLTAGRNPQVQTVRLGPAPSIAAELDAWQALLANPASSADLRRARGRTLAARVWAPIARTTTAERIFVITEGPLLRLPWSALPEGDAYLADSGRVFHQLNHERELLTPAARAPARYGLLAIADPRGGGSTDSVVRGNCAAADALPALPGARREVLRLQHLLDARTDAAPMLALLGDAASETRFRREAPQAGLLHLATHGIETGAGCEPARAGSRGLSLSAATTSSDTPGATALVLASPSADSEDSEDSAADGLLGALEIAALDLSRVQWAVLAACSTAAGSTHAYEGLYGLARAFRLAGARSVILSRWPVDDDATAQWSEALYDARLREHADTPAAMQRAQRAVLQARRAAGQSDHPYYWAGFFAIGDWR